MKPPPPPWPRISSSLVYDDPRAAIDWLVRAFGFEVLLLIDDGKGGVAHSELTFGEGLIMVGGLRPERFPHRVSPRLAGGGNTQNLMVYVDDAAAHLERARAAGAVIVSELETQDYGPGYWVDRGYQCTDPGGHHWWFYERLRENPPA